MRILGLSKNGQYSEDFPIEEFGSRTEDFNGAEIEECVKEAMFEAYVESPNNPKLQAVHIAQAIDKTVPLSKTMEKQITNLREWAQTRAKNASEESPIESRKQMPVLLTLPEIELERSFNLSHKDKDKSS